MLRDLEALLAAQDDSLQHLVRGDVGLKIARVPQLPDQFSEPFHQQALLIARGTFDLVVVPLLQEVVPQRSDV